MRLKINNKVYSRPKNNHQMVKVLEAMESTRVAWWTRRSDNMISIFFRMAHGNDPTGWINARTMQDFFGLSARKIYPDGQSGHIVLEIKALPKRARKKK